MCIPHGSTQTVSSTFQKRERHKKSIPFNEKLMKPDPDFVDERIKVPQKQKHNSSLLSSIVDFFKP